MAEETELSFGETASGDARTTTGSSRSTKEYKPFNENVVDFILTALQQKGEDVTWALKTADANELPDNVVEHFSLPEEVSHAAVEQFAPFDIESEGIGTPVNVTYEQLQESVEAGYLSEEELEAMEIDEGDTVKWQFDGVESSPQSDLSMCLNGFYSGEITDRFGDGSKVRVMAAKRSDVSAAHERYTNVRFYVSDSAQAPLSRERARMTVGQITESEFEEWAENNGFEDKV